MEQTIKSLSHPFPSVTPEKGKVIYGGSQALLPTKQVQDAGCGVIASANLLAYLTRYHGQSDGLFDRISRKTHMPLEAFNSACMRLARGLLRPIPGCGIIGTFLADGLNLYFRRHRMPYRARWCIRRGPMWERMAQMLDNDLPVIFAVGPNLPFWKKHNLLFYREMPDGSYKPKSQTRGHFITVTGMSEHWLRVSSWGQRLYINRDEYEAYVREHSSPILSNVLLLTEKKR